MRNLALRRTEEAEFTKILKRRGEKTAPWGTPGEGKKTLKEEPMTVTNSTRSARYEWNQESSEDQIYIYKN